MAKPAEVRASLVSALQLDLVGPAGSLGDPSEVLPVNPSRWYLTGFLAPDKDSQESPPEAAAESPDSAEEGESGDEPPSDRAAPRDRSLPSSCGLSVLLPPDAARLGVKVSWGEYKLDQKQWRRAPREAALDLDIAEANGVASLPDSRGLELTWLVRPAGALPLDSGLPAGCRVVSVFLTNRRAAAGDARRDEAFVFQVALTLRADRPFLARPDLRALESSDWDDRIADLQYRDQGEFAVGHNASARASAELAQTDWLPVATVASPEASALAGLELGMDALANFSDGPSLAAALTPLASQYRAWIARQAAEIPALTPRRAATAKELLANASRVADRIAAGLELLAADAQAARAFSLANRAMAEAARRRGIKSPVWRPFQLAFLLMNLRGLAQPGHAEREIVDLLFFPTGGGKTEAYLGLAAFTLVLRRLRAPGAASAGVAVLMRYTLRLLTLDQLGRAATLICALEQLRRADPASLGEWPFEIGLFVGQSATANHMGSKGDDRPSTARRLTLAYQRDSRKPSPIPLTNCPWCGAEFKPASFRLHPHQDYPTDLLIRCANHDCEFSRDRSLPIVAVDEPIYRRLPCFVIATVDKFAGLPWTGRAGALFGRVNRHDANGFYGPCDPALGLPLPTPSLAPPDLIIQDELHLISGPLGTMVGLYETALNGLSGRPKIIASTATARRAAVQIRALFNRPLCEVFPPPGPGPRDNFFAHTPLPTDTAGRLYLGVAAAGVRTKTALLRVYLALLASAQLAYESDPDAADPYMTLLGYFNSLRELGWARRVTSDEVRLRVASHGDRKRIGETQPLFRNRRIQDEPLELTSRVSSTEVAEAKRRLASKFSRRDHVDLAIATNMVSVGVDIQRLGLMVVYGQPKTAAEYIQATSRIGRSHPGLVVTVFNSNRPRDRSHYERFTSWHESFYRHIEAASVTPFSARALDRGLAGALVGLARHALSELEPPLGAGEILNHRRDLNPVAAAFADRARNHQPEPDESLRASTLARAKSLLDAWAAAAQELRGVGADLQYNRTEAGAAKPLLHDMLDPDLAHLPPTSWPVRFRAPRSLRDVEPSVNIELKTLDLQAVAEPASDGAIA